MEVEAVEEGGGKARSEPLHVDQRLALVGLGEEVPAPDAGVAQGVAQGAAGLLDLVAVVAAPWLGILVLGLDMAIWPPLGGRSGLIGYFADLIWSLTCLIWLLAGLIWFFRGMVGPLTGLVRCLVTAHVVRVEGVEASLDPVLIVGVILIGVLMVAVPKLILSVTLHLEPGEGGPGGGSCGIIIIIAVIRLRFLPPPPLILILITREVRETWRISTHFLLLPI